MIFDNASFSFQIPLLNNISPDNVKPNSLIRCRCMVQDQFDPEYYLGNYETLNKTTGQKVNMAL